MKHFKLVPTEERMNTTARLFGLYFSMKLEPLIFQMASELSTDYQGGYWEFYTTLDGTGFLMCPDTDQRFNVKGYNDYRGQVSAEAFGIIVCMHAFSYQSFDDEHPSGPVCGYMYHRLREEALDHPEARAILAAID